MLSAWKIKSTHLNFIFFSSLEYPHHPFIRVHFHEIAVMKNSIGVFVPTMQGILNSPKRVWRAWHKNPPSFVRIAPTFFYL